MISPDTVPPSSGRPLTGKAVLFILVAFFGTIFFANAILLRMATGTFRGLETESAYRASQRFNVDAQAAREQAARGWQIDAAIARVGDDAEVTVIARDALGRTLEGLEGRIVLARPADKKLDKTALLQSYRGGRYGVSLEGVGEGQWDLVLTLEREGERMFHSRSRVILK